MASVNSPSAAAPRLSVTVLNYNYARYLPECLDSILSQTFRDFELIVIDDCSQDDSVAVIRRYLSDPRVRLIAHEKNVGFSGSLIEGSEEHSRGEFLTVVSADDLILSPHAFARQMAAFDGHPNTVLSFTACDRFIDGTGEVYEAHRVFADDTIVRGADAFFRYMTDRKFWAPHSGTIFRRTAYAACGGYPARISVGLDFALFSAIALEGDFAYVAEALHGYRNHDGQMSVSFGPARRNTPEFLAMIDDLCDRAIARDIDIGDLRRRATDVKLSGLALQDAFSGRARLALVRTWDLLRRRPSVVLRSKDFAVVVARSCLGEHAFEWLRSLARTVRSPRGAAVVADRQRDWNGS